MNDIVCPKCGSGDTTTVALNNHSCYVCGCKFIAVKVTRPSENVEMCCGTVCDKAQLVKDFKELLCIAEKLVRHLEEDDLPDWGLVTVCRFKLQRFLG